MGVHEWSYDNAVEPDQRYIVPHGPTGRVTLKDRKLEVELGFDIDTGFKEAERCLNCDVQTVFDEVRCIECDACVDICPTDCISFTFTGEEDDLRGRLGSAWRATWPRTFTCRRTCPLPGSWSRMRTFACTVVSAPSAAPPRPGICRSFSTM